MSDHDSADVEDAMMAHFGGFLDVRQLGHSRWMTLRPLTYDSDLLAAHQIVVPAEFITDLSSVPRLPFAYMLTGDRARGPAVIHDWLYQHPDWQNRTLADAIFQEAMGVSQLEFGFAAESWLIRKLMWAGVRAGGWYAWNHTPTRARLLNPIWSATGWPERITEAP
jgi:hypothetical protein